MSDAAAAAPVSAPSTSQAMAGASPTGAPPTPSTGGGGPTINDVNPGGWMAGFSDDLKGRVSSKGWKGPVDLADSYFNLEKLMGAPKERLATLPEKFMGDDGKMTPEARSLYERLGTPKEAKGYELEKLLPKENGDPKLMAKFQDVFYDAGVPKAMAEKIVSQWNDYQASELNTVREQAIQRFKDSDASLKKEWGAAYEQNTNIAKEGVRRLGHDAKIVDALSNALGHDKTMKLYQQIGSAVGESAFIGGKPPGSTIMEPASAAAKIKDLKADKGFMDRFSKGDTQALDQWTKLHQQAFPGTTSVR